MVLERQIDSSQLRTGFVIKAVYDPDNGPHVEDEQIFWIRGVRGGRDLLKRMVRVEDQLGRSSEIPAIVILGGRIGPYLVEGVYSAKEVKAVDPKSLKINGGEDNKLEPIEHSRLGLNTLVYTTTRRRDIWPTEFNLRLGAERFVDGMRFFDADVDEEEGATFTDIPEADFIKGRHEWMRFKGIVPSSGNGN